MRFSFVSASFSQCAVRDDTVQLLCASTMTERTNEESFNELYADVLSDCSSDCESNYGDLENNTVSEDSKSDIMPPKYQKRNKIE